MTSSLFGNEDKNQFEVTQVVNTEIRRTVKEYWFVIAGVIAIFATMFGVIYTLQGRISRMEGQMEMLIHHGDK